jgi:hypothetical protein
MEQLDHVLSALKREYEPDQAAPERVRALIAASLPGLAAPTFDPNGPGASVPKVDAGAAGAAGQGPLSSSGWLGSAAVKVSLVALAVGGLVAASVVPGADADKKSTQSTSAAHARMEQASRTPARAPERDADRASLNLTEPTPVHPAPTVASAAPSRARQVTSRGEPLATRGVSLEELTLLREASQALRAGRLGDAERALSAHRAAYPKSELGRERQGLSLLVRCADGVSAETRAAAERFVRTAGQTPIADSVKKTCLP